MCRPYGLSSPRENGLAAPLHFVHGKRGGLGPFVPDGDWQQIDLSIRVVPQPVTAGETELFPACTTSNTLSAIFLAYRAGFGIVIALLS